MIWSNHHKQISQRVVIAIILLGWLLTACGGFGQSGEPTPTPAAADEFSPVVSATGVVVPAQQAALSLSKPGVVAEVLVGEGEAVEAGQVLVRLEGQEQVQAEVSAARFEIAQAQEALDHLYEDPQSRAAEALKRVADLHDTVRSAERRLANLLTESPSADVRAAHANMILAQNKYEDAQEDYAEYENKPEDNLTRAAMESKLAQAQKEYEATVRRYNNLLGTANEIDLGQAEADLAVARANLAEAQRKYELLKQGPDADDVALAQDRLENSKVQLMAAQAALADLVLAAPFAGVVSSLSIHSNEYAASGQPVLQLADLSHLRVETTDLNEIDVARVAVGAPVTITFDALPDVSISGKVTRVAPKAAEGSGVNYPVVVELDEIPEKLRWGMTAFVDIEVEGIE